MYIKIYCSIHNFFIHNICTHYLGIDMPSHGSLTKAGKVRNATPKIPAKPKKNLPPRRRNWRNYRRRILYAELQQPRARRR